MDKLRLIEIAFPTGVKLDAQDQRALNEVVQRICEKWEAENPGKVMWASCFGSRPKWSKNDARFLGVPADPDAPEDGEPTFDDTVFRIDVSAREDIHDQRKPKDESPA